MIDKSKVCVICATIKGAYTFDGIKNMGYQVMIPYRDYNLIMRCLREAWYRLHLPARHLWYNPQCKKAEADLFIVRDSLMSAEYLSWLRKHHPNSRIILEYDNMAHTTIDPNSVTDPSIEKWTYDLGDAERYNMNMKAGGYYTSWKCTKTVPPAYDVVYVGADKGRVQKLFAIEDQLKGLGLKTHFHICANRSFLRWTKPYYKPFMAYKDYLSLIGNSRAVLNVVQEGAVSITMREVEAIYHNVKCITNNPIIKESGMYHPSRYFILGDDPIEDLPKFLETPFEKVPEEMLWGGSYDRTIEKMLAEDPRVQ